MQEEDRLRLKREFEAMSDEQLREKLLFSEKEKDPQMYEILWQEAKRRSAEGKLHKVEASVKRSNISSEEDKILDLEPSLIKMVVLILVLNALGSIVFFILLGLVRWLCRKTLFNNHAPNECLAAILGKGSALR